MANYDELTRLGKGIKSRSLIDHLQVRAAVALQRILPDHAPRAAVANAYIPPSPPPASCMLSYEPPRNRF